MVRGFVVLKDFNHKVFISYHPKDEDLVDDFIGRFDVEHEAFIFRSFGTDMGEDIIDSTDTSFVSRRIRELYLQDSTVTVVLIGECTWTSRFVDWEIQSSLSFSDTFEPNGLLGIKLPSCDDYYYPERLNMNLVKTFKSKNDCYARIIDYPQRPDTIIKAVNDAYHARKTRRNLIINPDERLIYDRICHKP